VDLLDRPEWRLAVAFGIGLVIGAERERRKAQGRNRGAAGIRTFTLAAALGAVAFHLGPVAVVAFGCLLGAAMVVAYALGDRSDPGLTTEVALVLTYALGTLAQTDPRMAMGVGLLAAMLLAYRNNLHHLVRGVLTRREVLDFLILAVSALVVLPMLPDRALDPLGAFNPHRVWQLAVLMMALTGAGHVAQRLVGPRLGLTLAGLASGFVSATATVSALAVRSRQSPELTGPTVAGASASMLATFFQMAVLIGSTSPALLGAVAMPLGIGAGVALVYAGVQTAVAARGGGEPVRAAGRAFDLRMAVGFALLLTAVNVVATLAGRWLGQAGVVATTGAAGFADVHAPSAALASLVAGGQVTTALGLIGVLAAFTANTCTKALVTWQGNPAFRRRVILGLALVLVAVWAGFLVPRLTG
jgi:uncharacterized membrane protein (DUF4010 family)